MQKRSYNKSIFITVPILRLLLPLIAGILIQFHLNVSLLPFFILVALGISGFVVYQVFSTSKKFQFSWLSGIAITVFFIGLGGILSFIKNIENNQNWIGKYYQNDVLVKVTLQEDIIEKEKSFKALSKAEAILINNEWQPVQGNILLYFKKDSTQPKLQYGSQIVITKGITPIINAGNPGGFNYARYCTFQNISYQAFIADNAYLTLPTTSTNTFNSFLNSSRIKILSILQQYITQPNTLGIAQALLIGYRDNLDRDLVQSYSNTGVVHIIAISGLHLGMIYGLLLFLIKPFSKNKMVKLLKPIFILLVLWGFSFIAGAAPSILRSAVMFTFIIIGENIGRKSNMYNSLAASAFLLLLINPFNLWDVGFQLSYTAVLSIVIFQKYINRWLYFQNPIIKKIWSLNAVSLAAQILTLPIVVYHFHQFPNLFLITNIVAVPLSGLILYAELFLLVVSINTTIATFIGNTVSWFIQLMNSFIERADSLPFAVWPSLQISILQTGVLYISILAITWCLIKKQQKAFIVGVCFLLLFFGLRTTDIIQKNQQQKLVVYNVPNHTAIDIIEGRNYYFIGDSTLVEDGFLRNFHIKPSRVLHRITPTDTLQNFSLVHNIISCNGKNVLIIDEAFAIPALQQKINIDVIVLTKNPKIYLNRLSTIFNCKQYVFDSSNPFWKIAYWKKDADSLHLQHHSTATQGAFVMNF